MSDWVWSLCLFIHCVVGRSRYHTGLKNVWSSAITEMLWHYQVGQPKGGACLLIAEMSSVGNLATGDYAKGKWWDFSVVVCINNNNNIYWSLLYSTVLCSWVDSLYSCQMQFWIMTSLLWHGYLNIHQSGVLTALFGCYMAGAMWNCCHLGTCYVYMILETIHQFTLSLHAKPNM